jgi:hypothetical protein
LRTRRPSDASWTLAWQGWGDDNNTPPCLRTAIAGETLAIRIIAISTATIKTLIIRFIG